MGKPPPWIERKNKNSKSGFTSRGNKDYQTQRWRKDRAAHLRAYPLCCLCALKGITTAATISDHKKQVSQGGDFWDWDNRQPLCTSCHGSKSAQESHSKSVRG